MELSELTISPKIAASLPPRKVVRRLEVIPVEKRDDVLVVASAEPQRPGLITELSRAAQIKVELAVAYEVYIAETSARYFAENKESRV